MKRMIKVVLGGAAIAGLAAAVVSGKPEWGFTAFGAVIGGALIMWAILKAGGN